MPTDYTFELNNGYTVEFSTSSFYSNALLFATKLDASGNIVDQVQLDRSANFYPYYGQSGFYSFSISPVNVDPDGNFIIHYSGTGANRNDGVYVHGFTKTVSPDFTNFYYAPDANADNTYLFGDAGDDVITGTDADEVLRGGVGLESPYDPFGLIVKHRHNESSGQGDDTLLGGGGNDILIADGGSDTLTGGSGNDVFVADNFLTNDTITDFTAGEDVINLATWALGGVYLPTAHGRASATFADLQIDPILENGVEVTGGFVISDGYFYLNVYSTNITSVGEFTSEMFDFTQDHISGLNKFQLDPSDDYNREYVAFTQPGIDTVGVGNYFGRNEDYTEYYGTEFADADHNNDFYTPNDGNVTVYGYGGNDTFRELRGGVHAYGGDGDDILWVDTLHTRTTDGARLYGDAGNDTLRGDVYANYNQMHYYGGTGEDELIGGYNRDNMYGGSENDHISGGGGNDLIYDGAGDDFVYGGAGNDRMYSGAGADAFYGGSGSDRVFYTGSNVGITIDLTDASRSTGIAHGDTYSGITQIDGSNHDDTIIIDGSIQKASMGHGDDTIVDLGGNTHIWGGPGADTFEFHIGQGTSNIRDFSGSNGQGDVLDLTNWDVLGFDDSKFSIVRVFGEASSKFNSEAYLVLNNTDTGETDRVRISDVTWDDAGNHTLTADDFVFAPVPADGIVSGTDGNDRINGSYTDVDGDVVTDLGQTIEAGAGSDLIYDGAGDDFVYGGAGNDRMYSGAGADAFYGGSGSDRVFYTGSNVGITIDLTDASRSTGIAHGDTYSGITQIDGSNHDDTIIMDGSIQKASMGHGDDTIVDLGGNTHIWGGPGADTFEFHIGQGTSNIRDFSGSNGQGDVLDLTNWDVLGFDDSKFSIVRVFGEASSKFNSEAYLVLNNTDTGETDRVRISDVTWDDAGNHTLTADDFVFA